MLMTTTEKRVTLRTKEKEVTLKRKTAIIVERLSRKMNPTNRHFRWRRRWSVGGHPRTHAL